MKTILTVGFLTGLIGLLFGSVTRASEDIRPSGILPGQSTDQATDQVLLQKSQRTQRKKIKKGKKARKMKKAKKGTRKKAHRNRSLHNTTPAEAAPVAPSSSQ